MQGAPLSIVLLEILKHTPAYVWGILAVLVAAGFMQMRDQVVGRARVLVIPVVLAAYSLASGLSTFGTQVAVVAAWALGVGAMLLLGRWVRWPSKVDFLPERNAFAVTGSVIPLFVLLAVFASRYVATVTLVLNPQWRGLVETGAVGGLLYGLLAGVFALRARTILSQDTAPVAVRGLVAG